MNHQPKSGEKISLQQELENPILSDSKARFETGTRTIEVPYLNLFQYSRIFQEEMKQNTIIDRLSHQLKEVQERLEIEENSVLTFFQLLNNEEVIVKEEEFINLLILTDLFKIDKLAKILRNYMTKHKNDIEFMLGLKISEEKKRDKYLFENYSFSTDIENCLFDKINECFLSDKINEISVSSVYRMIEKSCQAKLSTDSLCHFILDSIEERCVLFEFVEVEKLSEETFCKLIDRYLKDDKEENQLYYEYLPISMKYISKLRAKEKSQEKQIETLEEKQNELKQKNEELLRILEENKRRIEELTKIQQQNEIKLKKEIEELTEIKERETTRYKEELKDKESNQRKTKNSKTERIRQRSR